MRRAKIVCTMGPAVESPEKAAELINQAERPFVIFGQGVILGKAEKEFAAFIEISCDATKKS